MHNAAYDKMGISSRYLSYCVKSAKEAIGKIRELGIRGASITIPFKTDIMKHLDRTDQSAVAIGAVNTVTREDGLLCGANTDWLGLVTDLKEKMTIRGKTFLVLGTGGTARAALYGIIREGGIPVLCGRTKEKMEALAAAFGCGTLPPAAIGDIRADCLINATPVGMHPHNDASPVDKSILCHFRGVMDVIYNPPRTKLLADAEDAGCIVLSGVGMFVNQGAEQIRLWTGLEPPKAVMREIVRQRLEES
jgi:shikimate dehydrogenase